MKKYGIFVHPGKELTTPRKIESLPHCSGQCLTFSFVYFDSTIIRKSRNSAESRQGKEMSRHLML